MKSKLKLILLVTMINLNCVSYFSNFCKVAGEKNTSKKRICTFYKAGKKLFGESSKALGIALDMGINGNRVVSKKTKAKTKKGKNLKTDVEKISSTETTKEPKGKNKKQI